MDRDIVKSKIRIAYNGDSDFINIFSSQFDLIEKPNIVSLGNKFVKNFDLFLITDDLIDSNILNKLFNICKLLNIPVVGMNRIPKSLQYMYFKTYNIGSPETYFISNNGEIKMNTFGIINILQDIKDESIIVIKIERGARGLGQVLTTKRDLIQTLQSENCNEILKSYDSNSFTSYDFNINETSGEKSTFVKPSDNKFIFGNGGFHELLSTSIRSGTDFIIQQKLEIEEEYRLLYFFNEEPIVIKRKMGSTWQANSCITGGGIQVSIKDIDSKLLENINKLCKALQVPYLSLDVYKTTNNKWGCFEFQTEFGVKFVPYQELCQKANSGLLNLYEELKNNGKF